MSANINQRNSPELRLQPEAISLQPQAITCPKCQHQRTAADQGPAWQCPNCGIAYNKATAQADDAVVHKVIRTSGAGGGQQMVAIGGCVFWVVALLLNVLPGTDGDNDYGPPPGPNTFLVNVGAVLFIAFTALAVVANIKYMQYIRSGKVHTSSLASAPG